MAVGMVTFWQHAVPGVDDSVFVAEELRLGELAEEYGFDFVGMPEHHFEDYSMCVDNIQALSYLAGKTQRIGLMTAVVVLPWHDPIRVAERMILLDHMSGGRAMFGIGRGLAPKEYAAFGIDQNEARERFDEMGEMILRALETGYIEGDGPFYPLDRYELRPKPLASFRDRVFGVANSPSSVEAVARLGARLTVLVAEHLEDMVPNIELYRKVWRETHDTEPLPPLFNDFTFCTRDPELAERARNEWFAGSWEMTLDHYQLRNFDFNKLKGYEAHASNGRPERPGFAETQVWGTPEEIIEGYRRRIDVVGESMASWVFRFGGMPFDICEQSIRLFCEEALPEIRRMMSTPLALPALAANA
jgi:alkanesulfonate monooxygenase SsuD/methylene tetrahydromethanopterin reductase-like flavin-dependent oxidoreductase (luciferase family)